MSNLLKHHSTSIVEYYNDTQQNVKIIQHTNGDLDVTNKRNTNDFVSGVLLSTS